MQFVYVKIPLVAGVPQRLPLLRDELERALAADGVGELLGWGGSLGTTPGSVPAHHRLDIEVADLERGLGLLKEVLARFAVPAETELHYTQARQALQMLYGADGWAAPTPSTATSRAQPSRRSLGRAR